MSEREKEKRSLNDRTALLAIVAVFVVTGLVFLWTSSNYRSDGSANDTWIDEAGRLHVLGVVLGESTLRSAEKALKSRSDIALYIYPDTHKDAGMRLEAFFPSLADHSKVILVLSADQGLLEQIQQNSTVPHIYPNSVARMNLHPVNIPTVQQLKVARLTLIPSVSITAEMLKSRFGEASSISTDEDGSVHYFFPDVGLEAVLSEKDAAMLHFSNPSGR